MPLLEGRTCWIRCLFLPSSDWKVGALQSYTTGVAIRYDLVSWTPVFSYNRRQSPAVPSWRTIGAMNVVSGLSERDECLFRGLALAEAVLAVSSHVPIFDVP